MNENTFLFKKVSFNQYFNESGKRIKAKGFKITGELFDFINHKTEDGLQIVGVVFSEDREVFYVPTLALTLEDEIEVVN